MFYIRDSQLYPGTKILKIDSTEFFLELIKIRSKIFFRDRKNRNFRKFYRRISIEIFRFFENFSDFRFFENFQLKSVVFFRFSDFSIFGFSTKISKSIFDQKFSIFFHDFFLNRFYFFPVFILARLEYTNKSQQRVKLDTSGLGVKRVFLHYLDKNPRYGV